MTNTQQPGLRQLALLRGRLTAWYLATFLAILALLGGGLFLVIRHQLSQQLDQSLVAAAQELIRAAHIREMESAQVRGPVVDAIDEVRIPERTLFLLDTAGRPIKPDTAAPWIRHAARRAALEGHVSAEEEVVGERTLRMYGERFALASGTPLIAVAITNDLELEDRYASLITAFGVAAFAALLMVAGGGWFLARKSTLPIERSVERMRRFMADAAHELRTPLTVIRSRAEVIRQQPRTEDEYRSALESVESETERLGGIVDNLLMLARADSGELPLRTERFFLDDVAIDAAQTAHVLAERKGVSLALTDFDETPIEGDRTLVRQLVMILLDNAVKFTPANGTVSVRVASNNGKGGPVLEVTDTGAGIPTEHLAHVFERFYRADPARGRSDGAGLGLSIARWIALEHGAEISIESPLPTGHGTRVTVRFPASETGRPSPVSGS